MSSRSYSAGSVARGQSSPRPLYAVLYLNRADVIPGVYGLAFSGTCLLLASALSIPSLHGLLISYKVLDNSAWLYKEVVTYSTTVGWVMEGYHWTLARSCCLHTCRFTTLLIYKLHKADERFDVEHVMYFIDKGFFIHFEILILYFDVNVMKCLTTISSSTLLIPQYSSIKL